MIIYPAFFPRTAVLSFEDFPRPGSFNAEFYGRGENTTPSKDKRYTIHDSLALRKAVPTFYIVTQSYSSRDYNICKSFPPNVLQALQADVSISCFAQKLCTISFSSFCSTHCLNLLRVFSLGIGSRILTRDVKVDD